MARHLISTDTVLDSNINYNGDVVEIQAKITGAFTISNAVIEANPYIEIFGTEVILVNCKTREFSTAWYGAKSTNSDNSVNLQKAIDTCVSNGIRNLFVADSYHFGTSLTVKKIVSNTYVAVGLNIYGTGDMWDNYTILTYTASTGFAIGFQVAKGGSISRLLIQGNYVAPTNTGISYYNTDFTTRIGYAGLVIDYDGTKNVGGSTALQVHDIMIDAFDVLYSVSPNGVTFNADALTFTNIHCGNGRIGFQSGQAQEKGNSIHNIVSWGNLHTLISIGLSGKYQAGQYIIRNGNVAGNCVQLFDISLSGWNGFDVQGFYAESIARIGTIYAWTTQTKVPVNLQDMHIRLGLKSQVGDQVLFTSNSPKVKIQNSEIWYYGTTGETMSWYGSFTFENCDFGMSTWISPNITNIRYFNGHVETVHTQG